jgi:integral membrane protein
VVSSNDNRFGRTDTSMATEVGHRIAGMSLADQLRRKIRVTKIIALAEAVSYCLLAGFMFNKYALGNRGGWHQAGLRIVAYFHGMICIAFGVMVLDIFRVMKWTKAFLILTLAGPPGAILAHRRLTTQPLPTSINKKDMIF